MNRHYQIGDSVCFKHGCFHNMTVPPKTIKQILPSDIFKVIEIRANIFRPDRYVYTVRNNSIGTVIADDSEVGLCESAS